jgi:thiol peroxidase
MKHLFVLLAMITSGIAYGGYQVTQQTGQLGKNHNVTLENSTTFSLGGHPVKVGDLIPDITLTNSVLKPVETHGSGKVRIYNLLVSIDTPVCVEQAIEFSTLAEQYVDDTEQLEFINISADTPFAQARFISERKFSQKVMFLSDSYKHEFGQKTGTNIEELGLLSRAIIVVGKDDRILHIQRVPELTQLPDLKAAIMVAKRHI